MEGGAPEIANRPLIEATYEELIGVLEAHVTEQRYLFGSRPSRADFALYGQLWQLASDPTPSALMRERAPYAFRWVRQLDDACGVEGEWSDPAAPPPEAVKALLRACGDVYLLAGGVGYPGAETRAETSSTRRRSSGSATWYSIAKPDSVMRTT